MGSPRYVRVEKAGQSCADAGYESITTFADCWDAKDLFWLQGWPIEGVQGWSTTFDQGCTSSCQTQLASMGGKNLYHCWTMSTATNTPPATSNPQKGQYVYCSGERSYGADLETEIKLDMQQAMDLEDEAGVAHTEFLDCQMADCGSGVLLNSQAVGLNDDACRQLEKKKGERSCNAYFYSSTDGGYMSCKEDPEGGAKCVKHELCTTVCAACNEKAPKA